MPDLNFQVEGAAAVPYSTSPLLALKLRITNADAEESIQSGFFKRGRKPSSAKSACLY